MPSLGTDQATAHGSGMLRYICALLVMTAFASAQAASEDTQRYLPPKVSQALRAYRLPAAAFSAYVQEVGSPTPLLAFNENEPRNPASTIKVLTTFLALDELGPTYRWRTEAYLAGERDGGTLNGDLILKGYGDPYLVTERLWLFLRELRNRGLTGVTGDLVIDNSYFVTGDDDEGRFDGQPYRTYNVLPDALLVNFKTVSFVFRPDPVTSQVRILADPRPANLDIGNELEAVKGTCAARGTGIDMRVTPGEQVDRVVFRGRLGSGCDEYRLTRTVLTAPEYAYGVIKSLWEEMGGTLGGGLRLAPVPDGLKPFVRFESPPLAEVIRSVNKFSNNVMTRQIFLTLGAEREGPPATLEKSRRSAQQLLDERGLDFPELVIDNGAGLSRDTRISARSMARVLLAADRGPFRSEFEASLSLAGLDGTLARRFRREPLAGQMHLKSGTLSGVYAVAGYVNSQSGKRLVVVALHNHPKATWAGGQEAQSALLRWVYER